MAIRRVFRGAVVLCCACLVATEVYAIPIDQTGNLLNNGSFETGTTDVVAGHHKASAADRWWQWENYGPRLTGGANPTTELVTDAEMMGAYGVGVIDGDKAFRVTTTTAASGAYTLASWHSPSWDTNQTLTFSAWVYTIRGVGGIRNGSNQDGFIESAATTTGEWEYLSMTIAGGRLNNEPLLYSSSGAGGADFIVDAAWLNYGETSENPLAPVPEPATLLLLGTGLLGVAKRGLRRKADT